MAAKLAELAKIQQELKADDDKTDDKTDDKGDGGVDVPEMSDGDGNESGRDGDTGDEQDPATASTSKRRRKHGVKATAIHFGEFVYFDPKFTFHDKKDIHIAAAKVWAENRYTSSAKDATSLLAADGNFVKKHTAIEKQFHFVFADLPWGILKARDYDVLLSLDQARKIMDGLCQILHPMGTIVLRLGRVHE